MFCIKPKVLIPELFLAFLMEKKSNFYPRDACCRELGFSDKSLLAFFFFSLKLFTDKKYSSYCDLASWKVWLIINIIIYAFVCGSSKSPRHILGLISLTCCSGSCADLVTVSGDGSVLR